MGKISKKDENKEGFSEINIKDFWMYALIAVICIAILVFIIIAIIIWWKNKK